jgi:hypothetical protein
MINGATQTKGYTVPISVAAMAQPLVLTSRNNGGPIRSVTIGNQSTSTTVVVYGSALPQGSPLFAVVPGQFCTIPIQESSAVALVFVCAAGYSFNGGIYVHTDTEPLSASGFISATSAPLWVWDSSAWDGGAVWSG